MVRKQSASAQPLTWHLAQLPVLTKAVPPATWQAPQEVFWLLGGLVHASLEVQRRLGRLLKQLVVADLAVALGALGVLGVLDR